MGIILAVSHNLFHRALKSKTFLILLLFALILILLSRLFEFLTFTAEVKIIKDVGLASIYLFVALIALCIAGESMVGEIEKKTTYILFSKPVSKGSFILGNFLGMVWVIGLSILVSGSALFLVIYLKQGTVEGILWAALGFSFLEALVVASIALMFSSFSSSTSTSILFSFLFYLAGHLNPQLCQIGKLSQSKIIQWITKIIGWVLPNLEYFNIRGKIAQGGPLPKEYVGETILYAFIYIGAMLTLACLFLRRREL